MINNKSLLIFLSKLAEVYPIGHFKYAPGTFASLVGLIFGYYILIILKIKLFLLFVFIFVIIGYLLCEAHVKLHKKKNLPSKTCPVCNRPFNWRKKWEKNWDKVVYCSERCRNARNLK